MAFQEFGEALRLLREEKGVSVDDVARRIKIPGRILREFENGEQNCALHPVYCRGFAKAYAEFLGMDKTMLETALNELYPPEDEEYDSPVLVPPKRGQHITSGRVAALILIVLLAAGAWYVRSNDWPKFDWLPNLSEIIKSSDAPADAPAEASSQAAEQTPTTPPAAPSSQADQPGPLSGGLAANATQGPDADATRNAATITPNLEDLTPPVQANATISTAAGSGSGPHRLVISTSTHDCWTESKVDDQEKRTVYLKRGQTHILSFQNSLTLRLGNITGVKLRLDGQPYDMPPGRGSTRDLVFGAAADAAGEATP